MNVKVKQMIGNSGNPVANQFIISDNRGNTYFQSYNTVIAKRDRNEVNPQSWTQHLLFICEEEH